MIEAVIFDMDGLLVDSEPFWQETERSIMSNFGVEITDEMHKESIGLSTEEQIAHWYNYQPWPNPDFPELERLYNEIMQGFFKTKAELLPGVEYILDFFKKKKLKIALASSSNMTLINSFISKFNLAESFDGISSAETEEFAKPHPAVYIKAAKYLNVKPTNCIAFEDSVHGVIAGKAAKMKVVAIPDKAHFSFPGYLVADLKIKSLNEFGEKEFNKINNNSMS